MKVQLHAANFAGQPLPGTGTVLEGADAAGIVEAMRREAGPFGMALEPRAYCDGVLKRIGKGTADPLPETGAEEEFIRRLAAAGYVRIVEY